MIDSGVSGFSRDEKVQNLPASRSSSELSAHQMAPAGVIAHSSPHAGVVAHSSLRTRADGRRQFSKSSPLRSRLVARCRFLMSYSFADQVLAQLDLLKNIHDVPQGLFKDGGALAGVVAHSSHRQSQAGQAYPASSRQARAPSRSNRQLHPRCRRVTLKGSQGTTA